MSGVALKPWGKNRTRGDEMNSIEKLRYIESRISRKEVARRIGVAYNSVYRWISGRSDPDKSRSKVTVKAIDALFRKLGGKE